MRGPDPANATVELVALDPSTDAGPGHRYAAVVHGEPLARFRVDTTDGWLRPSAVRLRADSRTPQRRALLASLLDAAQERGFRGVVLEATAPLLLRHDARAVGFGGGLRGELAIDRRAPEGEPTEGITPEERLTSDLRCLLPEVTVRFVTAGKLRRLLLRGATNIAFLEAQTPGDARPLRLVFPMAGDVMVESLAMVVDTALSIRRRFRPSLDPLRIIFDQSRHGFVNGRWAGMADQTRDVRLTPAYLLVSELESLTTHLAQRSQPAATGERGHLPRARSYPGAPPFTRIDAVVAHELWHEIQFDFDNRRYRDSIEFRRSIGSYFGTETLEQVIKGKEPKAPPAWQAARGRLADEVSIYATTNPVEATAELFSVWWCTPLSPPPVAQAFGRILHQFFPTADLVR